VLSAPQRSVDFARITGTPGKLSLRTPNYRQNMLHFRIEYGQCPATDNGVREHEASRVFWYFRVCISGSPCFTS